MRFNLLLYVMIIMSCIGQAFGSMQTDIRDLKRFKSKLEIEMMRREALESVDATNTNHLDSNKVFKGGQTSQQALNPEISIVGDFYGKASLDADHSSSGFAFRVAGFHFQADLDPFSKAFLATSLTTSGIELGEAFIDYHKFSNINIRVGKFLQNFGVINRWHLPALDQWDNPLAPSMLLGGKINQTGVSVHWMMPSLLASSNELIVEVTNTDNTTLFHDTVRNPFPSGLVRFVNFYDISPSSYLNLGFSAIFGKNNQDRVESDRLTKAYGVDLTFLYEPVGRARYSSFIWRTELYLVDKEQIITGYKKSVKGYGLYSYIEGKLSDRTSVGFRYDYVSPLEWTSEGEYINQYVPYLTFWQSPWVKTRLQFNYKKEAMKEKAEKKLMLQITWAMGPHKHERY